MVHAIMNIEKPELGSSFFLMTSITRDEFDFVVVCSLISFTIGKDLASGLKFCSLGLEDSWELCIDSKYRSSVLWCWKGESH